MEPVAGYDVYGHCGTCRDESVQSLCVQSLWLLHRIDDLHGGMWWAESRHCAAAQKNCRDPGNVWRVWGDTASVKQSSWVQSRPRNGDEPLSAVVWKKSRRVGSSEAEAALTAASEPSIKVRTKFSRMRQTVLSCRGEAQPSLRVKLF